jgi:hypothetical protein
MDTSINWRDLSRLHTRQDRKESWIPNGEISSYEFSVYSCVMISDIESISAILNGEYDRINKGEILYPTREKAKERVRELIALYFNITPEDIVEY